MKISLINRAHKNIPGLRGHVFFSPLLLEKKGEGRKLRVVLIWKLTSSSLQFSLFIEEKCYFIHAISVHSPAGASVDSVPVRHERSYQWTWRQRGGPVGGEEGGRSRGWARGIYNKVALTAALKTFSQLHVITTSHAIQIHHTTEQVVVFMLVTGWRQWRTTTPFLFLKNQESIQSYWNILGFNLVATWTVDTRVGLQVRTMDHNYYF